MPTFDLKPGASKEQLLTAMRNQVLADTQLMCKYKSDETAQLVFLVLVQTIGSYSKELLSVPITSVSI